MTSGRLMFFDHHRKYLLDRVPPVITVDNTSVLLQRMLFLSFLQVMSCYSSIAGYYHVRVEMIVK